MGNSVQLRKALQQLPERTRIVLELQFLRGLTVAEVGSALGVSEATVRRTSEKAMRELRRVMKAQGWDSSDAGMQRLFEAIAPPPQRQAVEVTLEFPPNATREQIKAAVAQLVTAASSFHLAVGGSGLQIHDLQLERQCAPQEVH